MTPTDAENRAAVEAALYRRRTPGRVPGALNPYSSTDARIRQIIQAIDYDGSWPTPAKARQKGMHADNQRFRAIRDSMQLAGELHHKPTGPLPGTRSRAYSHPPGKPPQPEKPKDATMPWRPSWARGRSDTEEPLADAAALSLRSFFEYRKAWQRLESFPVDWFRRIVPPLRKKRKRVKG